MYKRQVVPTPGVSYTAVKSCLAQAQSGGLFGLINLFSGGALLHLSVFALGVGTTEPKRNKAMIERVKKIFLRSSGVLNAIPNAESINLLPLPQ